VQPDLQLTEPAPAGDTPSFRINSDIERTAA
jgi:hypothetical protein